MHHRSRQTGKIKYSVMGKNIYIRSHVFDSIGSFHDVDGFWMFGAKMTYVRLHYSTLIVYGFHMAFDVATGCIRVYGLFKPESNCVMLSSPYGLHGRIFVTCLCK
jgi:hypothetical protein